MSDKDKVKAEIPGIERFKLLPQDRYRLEKWRYLLDLGELVTLDSLDFPAIRHLSEAAKVERINNE
jgi:hypothetical protein